MTSAAEDLGFDLGRFATLRDEAREEEARKKYEDDQLRLKSRGLAPAAEVETITYQPGFQARFLGSRADITIGGGAAGCGKTYAELLAAARHQRVTGFSAVIFRDTMPQVRRAGGLWDESLRLYPRMGAYPNSSRHEWSWPRGAQVVMSHVDRIERAAGWQGAQVPLIIFDELTHFPEEVFWYMLSRNRSVSGVRPYMMASCNPDADSWVADLIKWWIDQDESSETFGLPIPSRAGKLRYFVRSDEQLVWADTRAELLQIPGVIPVQVKSLTFVPGKLEDNKILEERNPEYRGNLMGQSRVVRGRLLDGNWKIRASAGEIFRSSEATMIDAIPSDMIEVVRRWDLAATEPNENNTNPDWTVGVKLGKRANGKHVVLDVIFARRRADEIRQLVARTAQNDGRTVRVGLPQDPGQAGKDQAQSFTRMLAGFRVYTDRETGDKITRAEPAAAQWQAGNFEVVRNTTWNGPFFNQLEGFPQPNVHDDAVDALSGAFSALTKSRPSWGAAL